MKYIVPDYYRDFRCIAGACRHSCCIGWEIDVDEETLEYYQSLPEPWNKRLEENIVQGEDEAHFALAADERCPFLQPDGLCELIRELGEDSLCNICADHPRFRNYFSDREEMGLGLCCEAAARLILGKPEPVRFLCAEDEGGECPAENEEEVLAFRAELIDLAQNCSLPVERRAAQMAEKLPVALREISSQDLDMLLSLERLEDAWAERLEHGLPDALGKFPANSAETELALEQLLVYFLYRHIAAADDRQEAEEYAALALFLWELVRTLWTAEEQNTGTLTLEQRAEIARQCSAELEYSDENLIRIHDYLLTGIF